MDTQLLITTIGNLFSAGFAIAMGAFVLWQNPKRDVNVTFALFVFDAALYGIDFALGINLPPSPLAYVVWMCNLVNVFLNIFYLQFILTVTGQIKETRRLMHFIYAEGIILILTALVFPHFFLPEITPKLFAKSFLNAGPWYYVTTAHFVVMFLIATYFLIRAYYRKGANKRQIEYLIFASAVGYLTGPLDFFLVYNIPVNLIYGMFYGFYLFPIAYGIIATDLLDIRVVIKRAAIYAVGIALTAGALIALVLLNNVLIEHVPGLQFWTVPVVAAVVAFFLGRLYWAQAQEAERIKNEFIETAAHQLRTPLAAIKWSFNLLADEAKTEDQRALVSQGTLGVSNMERIAEELMMVARSSRPGREQYTFAPIAFAPFLREIAAVMQSPAKQRQITFDMDISENLPTLSADAEHLRYAIQNLLDNAIKYTHTGGHVHLAASADDSSVSIRISDTGIGISPDEKRHLFERFFRSPRAVGMFANGSGLGLPIVKSVVDAHRGRIDVVSEEDKGTTFTITLPTTLQS